MYSLVIGSWDSLAIWPPKGQTLTSPVKCVVPFTGVAISSFHNVYNIDYGVHILADIKITDKNKVVMSTLHG